MLYLLLLAASVRFVDVAPQAGLRFQHVSGSSDKSALLDTMSGGVAWIDYDNDGRVDLYFVNGGRREDLESGKRSVSNALFRNNGDGTFTDVTEKAGVAGSHWGMGVAAADYDNDGWVDLYVCNYGPNDLFRNRGDGTFVNVAAKANATAGDRWSSSASFADYDGDGRLDVYVADYVDYDLKKSRERSCAYRGLHVHCGPQGMSGAADVLLRGLADGTFEDVTARSKIGDAQPSTGLGVVWSDLDNDGDLDIYVANDSRPNFLFENRGDGTFSEVGLLSGTALSEEGNPQAGMGIAAGDYDRDGDIDLHVTNFSDDYNALYRNLGQGLLFVDGSYSSGIAFSSRQRLGWGTQFFDFDNDGWLDLFAANAHVYPQVDDKDIGTAYLQPKLLYRNLNGRFEDVSDSSGSDLRTASSSRGAAFADFDGDGDVDIAVNNLDGHPQLFRNEVGSPSGHWLRLTLEGKESNRSAVGARATVETAGWRQLLEVQAGSSFQSTNEPTLHFGLGDNEQVRRLTVRWPSGKEQVFPNLQSNRRYRLREGEKIEPFDESLRP